MQRNTQCGVGDFVKKFEAVYGDIRNNKKLFGSVYHKYYDKRFDWSVYEYYTRIPNHTRIEYDSMIMDRVITQLHTKYIHEECTGVTALRTITK